MLSPKKITLAKCRLNYLDSGATNESLIPILFLHGWALSPQSFKYGLELISNHKRVIAPDIFSLKHISDPLKIWRYEDYAEALNNLLDVLQISEAHIIGHSLGGGVSIALSALYPSKAHSITLIDSAGIPLGDFWKVTSSRLVELPAQAWESKFSFFHFEMIIAFLKNLVFRSRITFNALKLPLHTDLSEYMKAINDPCLVIWGREDLLIPLKFGKEINAKIRNSKLTIIDRAYHEWGILMPKTLAKLVLDFVTLFDHQVHL